MNTMPFTMAAEIPPRLPWVGEKLVFQDVTFP